jgi:hypothetical protein
MVLCDYERSVEARKMVGMVLEGYEKNNVSENERDQLWVLIFFYWRKAVSEGEINSRSLFCDDGGVRFHSPE